LLSQALTLFTSPVIYLYLYRLSARLNAAPQHARAPPSGNPAMPEKPGLPLLIRAIDCLREAPSERGIAAMQ
jgi:hypothetical protein